MFAVSLKEIQFPVEKQNLYVRNHLNSYRGEYIPVSSLSYVGECLINMDDQTVYQVGKHIRYTPTQDLIEQVLTEYSKFTSHIIYYSKDKSDVCINAIFPPNLYFKVFLKDDYRYALEISNYYSGRYSPKATLGLYNIQKNIMIRTSIPAFSDKRERNIEGIQKIYDLTYRKDKVSFGKDIMKLLPQKYQFEFALLLAGSMEYIILIKALNIIAEITDKWLETNYELATATQRKIYDILITNTIKE